MILDYALLLMDPLPVGVSINALFREAAEDRDVVIDLDAFANIKRQG